MIYLPNLIFTMISAVIAFFYSICLLQVSLKFFRIRNFRAIYFLKFIPYLVIFADSMIFHFRMSKWLNPLHCASCTRKLMNQYLYPIIEAVTPTEIFNWLHGLMDKDFSYLQSTLLYMFFVVSILNVVKKVIELFLVRCRVKQLIKRSNKAFVPIDNLRLSRLIHMHKTTILRSGEIYIPMATPYNTILIPQDTSGYNTTEYEAFIAHEMQHIKWKDPQFKILIEIMNSVFWWIPTSSWSESMSEDAELACDQSVLNRGHAPEDLASALVKTARFNNVRKLKNVCCLVDDKKQFIKRVKAILNSHPRQKLTVYTVIVIGFATVMTVLCLVT